MWVALITVSYLIGTIPNATWIARRRGVDIRAAGSGNTGASNVIRTLGYRWGIGVMALDMGKGAVAAALGLVVAGRSEAYVSAMAAVVGHVFPIWERFRGGKGVATGGGAFCVLSPLIAAVLIGVWFVVSKMTGKASVASITVVSLLPVGVGIVHRQRWEVLATLIICVLVIGRHLGNIKRLFSRTERSLK